MRKFDSFEHNGKRYDWFYDENHETIGSYAYETEEATKLAEQHEIKMLEKGYWVALGVVVSKPCLNDFHCGSCSGWEEKDSCWGIVIEPDRKKLIEYVKGGF